MLVMYITHLHFWQLSAIASLYSNNFIKWKQKMVAKTKPIRNDKVPSFLKYLSIPKTTHQD